jgi:hypothetical protein
MSFMTWLPYVNRLTASGSRADLLVRYYKTDQLNCQWKSITPSSTTTSDANRNNELQDILAKMFID